ncbi:MAG: hypothetical protein ABIP20_18390, partial [Chthoniobacteraceae bacterium]
MKPRLPPSRSLQVSNPGPNGFVLLGSPSASASWWKLRLPKRRSTGIILVALLVLCGSIAAFYLRREPTEIERLERAAYRGDTKAQVQLFSHYTAGLG